jgi:hypothetical protein
MKLILLKLFTRTLYNQILSYLADHPELDGATLRLRIRKLFGTSLSAAQLDKLLLVARTAAAAKDKIEGVE